LLIVNFFDAWLINNLSILTDSMFALFRLVKLTTFVL